MIYNYLPGTNVTTLTGGITQQTSPQDKSVLVLGVAGQGQADQPYQVTDPTLGLLEFGLQGDLGRTMSELMSTGCDNVILYRIGTTPLSLAGVGLDTAVGSVSAGFGISFGQVTATSATDYTLWYKNGVLTVYYQGEIVYSNDPAAAVDTGDITITGSITGCFGLELGTGLTETLAGSITVQAASALVGTASQPVPTMTAAVTGLGLTKRALYVAVASALDLLQGIQVDAVLVPSAIYDCPSVAFYVVSDATTAIHNPATNPDALDWLSVTEDVNGNNTYVWAGATVFANAAARLAAGYYEVSFGYLLANFCNSLSQLNQVCEAFIGTTGPATTKLVDVRTWIGTVPTYAGADVISTVTKQGRGLLGNPYLMGTTAIKMNPLCADYAEGYRAPGFFETEQGFYDGTLVLDPIKSNTNQIGHYVHVIADQAILSNFYATNYVANIQALAAGLYSQIDPKSAITNKPVAVTQLPGLVYTPTQLNLLTEARINVLRSKGTGNNPVFLHDYTSATPADDYITLLRMNILSLFIQTVLTRSDKFTGESSLDGLSLTSLKTNLDQDLSNLQQLGYWRNPQINIQATQAQANLGHSSLFGTFHPADELIQLSAYIGLSA